MTRDRFGRTARLAAGLLVGLTVTAQAGAERPGEQGSPERQRPAVAGEILVGFRAGVSASDQAAALRRAGLTADRHFGRIRALLGHAPAGREDAALAALRADPLVRYAEPNYVVHAADHGATPNDPTFHELWGLHNFGQTVNGVAGTADADVDAPEAWSFETGSAAVVVGVIDTGVDLVHPDLSANLWTNPGEVVGNGLDDDANGYVDDVHGWDFVNDDADPSDDNGHGTHVAGTIGARGDDGAGVTGLNWTVRLMPLKFLNASGSGTTADAVEAILYAAANGADVTNNSWSGAPYSQALLDALAAADAADSLFVAAAGNNGLNTDASPAYPSSYAPPNVVSVAATDSRDARPFFSNYGRRSVDLGAPGASVYSTWPGGGYRFASGTSMAAPHVAGAAALAKARFPGTSDLGLKALLLDTVDPNAALVTRTATGGRLNAGRAVACTGAPQLWVEEPAQGFEVQAGEPVAVTALAATCGDPSATTLAATANGVAVELTRRADGLYTGSFSPAGGGPVTLELTASSDSGTAQETVTGAATLVHALEAGGGPVSVTTQGENVHLAFEGSPGQRVSMSMSDVTIGTSTCCSTLVSVTRPDGGYLLIPTYVGTKGAFMDTKALTLAGTYRVLVDPQGASVGSMTFRLYDVPPDATGTLTPGTAETVATTAPGQNARLTFTGFAGARVSLAVADVAVGTSSCCSVKVSVLRPNGTYLVVPTFVGTKGAFFDAKALTTSGTYTVVVDPQGTESGSVELTLYDVPPDAMGSLAIGGPPVTVTVTTPGQNARLAFTGGVGQAVTLALTGVSLGTSACCAAQVSIVKPDGTRLTGPSYVGTNGKTVTAQLPVSGTYTVLLDPQGDATGNATAELS